MKVHNLAAVQDAGSGPGDCAGVAVGKAGAVVHSDVVRFDARDRAACIARWIDRFGKAPPRHISVC